MECTNQVFSDDFVNKFHNLDANIEYEFEIVRRSTSLNVVRLYIDGELFVDEQTPENGIKTDDIPKGLIETECDNDSIVNGIINLTIERAEEQELANQIMAGGVDHSTNGKIEENRTSANSAHIEADRINLEHFKSVEKMGLGTVPAN